MSGASPRFDITDDMIERACRAMCVVHGQDPEHFWRMYENRARAAIEAAAPEFAWRNCPHTCNPWGMTDGRV